MANNSSDIVLAGDIKNSSKAKSLKKGSSLEPIYGKRKLKVYPLYESELTQITYFNTLSTVMVSVGSFFASDAARDGVEKMFSTISGKVSISFFIVGFITMFLRWRTVNKIKKDAIHDP